MKRHANILVLSAVLLSGAQGYCSGGVDQLHLSRKEAIELAIRSNLDLHTEAMNAQMSKADAAGSHAIYDPVLTASASKGKSFYPGETFGTSTTSAAVGLSQTLPTGGSLTASTQTGYTNADSDLTSVPINSWQSSVSLTFTQPLLKRFGKTATELSITLASANLQDSLDRYRLYLADTVVAVISAYNHLYSLEKNLQAKQDAVASEQAMLEALKKAAKPSARQQLDIANLEYALSQKRRELVDGERNLRDQEAGLRYLIGLDKRTRINVSDAPSREEPKETQEQVLKSAQETRPELKQLRTAVKTSELQERVNRQQTLPDLSLTASGGFAGNSAGFGHTYGQIADGQGRSWSAGLQLSIPLGNTAARNEYRKSSIRAEQAKNQLRAMEWKVRNEVESDLRTLISARIQRQTSEQGLQYAQQRREQYHQQVKEGKAAVQDTINAENDLVSARNAQLDASEAFANAVVKLWRDTGVLLDHEGVRVEAANSEAGSANGNFYR